MRMGVVEAFFVFGYTKQDSQLQMAVVILKISHLQLQGFFVSPDSRCGKTILRGCVAMEHCDLLPAS